MASVTDLKKMNKDVLLKAALEMHKQINEEKNSVLNGNENEMSFEFESTSANCNDNLMNKIKLLEDRIELVEDRLYTSEVKLNKADQYQRRENIEIAGIPDNILQEELEVTVLNILKSIDVKTDSYHIVACHRLFNKNKNKPANTIVRFTNRKIVHEIFTKKKELCNTKYKEEFGKDFYISENLSSGNREILDGCLFLKKKALINSCWSYNGVINIKYKGKINERSTKLYHYDDIFHYIPKAEKFLD